MSRGTDRKGGRVTASDFDLTYALAVALGAVALGALVLGIVIGWVVF